MELGDHLRALVFGSSRIAAVVSIWEVWRLCADQSRENAGHASNSKNATRLAPSDRRAVPGSGCGVLTSKIVRTGQVVWGTSARPLKEYLEQLAMLSRLAKNKRRTPDAPSA